MKRNRMFMLALVALVLLPGLLFAMPSAEEKGGKEMRLAWWGNPTRDERTLKAADMFMAKYPEVKIESETTGWAGYWDKLNTQAAAGSATI